MAATYQFGANPPIDYPRLLVADTDVTKAIFQDSEILAASQTDIISVWPPVGIKRTISTPSYRRVAAVLLESLASNASRLGSALKLLDIDVDTRSAAKDLRATAQALRDAEANAGAFAMVEMNNSEFASRERTIKMFMRLYQ